MIPANLKERLIVGDKDTLPVGMGMGIYILMWLILALFPIMLTGSAIPQRLPLAIGYAHFVPFFLAFLVNHIVLVPRFLVQNRWKQYLFMVALVVGLSIGMKGIIHLAYLYFHPDFKLPIPLFFIVIGNVVSGILIIAFDTAVSMSGKWIRDRQLHQELERENLASQIAVLQHQISPHFFMNTLNNIHALVDLDPEKAKESCIRLSRMMRYMLYDSPNGTTSLSKEIDFIVSFFDLMRLRFDERVILEFEHPDNMPQGAIPSFLFLPFIENAFKHGIRHRDNSFIKARMSIQNHSIHFDCTNSISQDKSNNMEKSSGIGLTNLKQRLQLLYGNNYVLNTLDTGSTFQVHMEIPCP